MTQDPFRKLRTAAMLYLSTAWILQRVAEDIWHPGDWFMDISDVAATIGSAAAILLWVLLCLPEKVNGWKIHRCEDQINGLYTAVRQWFPEPPEHQAAKVPGEPAADDAAPATRVPSPVAELAAFRSRESPR